MRRMAALALVLLLGCSARSGGGSGSGRREFDGQRAFTYLERQMQLGPRIPGTPAHDSAGAWILAQLRSRADTVIVQPIEHRDRRGKMLHLRNFFARFRPEAAERILYLAHWDTRPHADQDPDSAKRRLPVPGASDGASGVAVLIGVADALKAKASQVGVDLLFVDGEDYGDFSDSNDVLIGARWFAAHQPAGYPPLFAVLFDMVGDKNLDIYVEQNSQVGAPEVVDRVWGVARDLGYVNVFLPLTPVRSPSLIDDHVALQKAGIHTIDVVDFDYPYWHTIQDTIDKVSAASLQVVGDVAMAVIRKS